MDSPSEEATSARLAASSCHRVGQAALLQGHLRHNNAGADLVVPATAPWEQAQCILALA